MHTQTELPLRYEIYIADLDNHVVIENSATGVVIRASRDNVSERRRTFFIRELAAEGYIPDRYEWVSDASGEGLGGVNWIADNHPTFAVASVRFLRKLCTGRNGWYGCAFLAWLLLFVWAVQHTSRIGL